MLNHTTSSEITFPMDNAGKQGRILYSVEERMSFVFSFLNALQIVVCQLVSLLWSPLQLCQDLCMLPADPQRVYFVATACLTSGIVTSLQATIGIRLTTVSAASLLYTSCFISLLQSPHMKCPSNGDLYAMGPDRLFEWQRRLREIQGALLFAGVVQVILGFSGLQSWLFHTISPAVVAPVLVLAGFTLVSEPISQLADQWLLCSIVFASLVLFALCLQNFSVPMPTFSMRSGLTVKYFPIFKLFSVIWTCIAAFLITKATTSTWSPTAYPDERLAFDDAIKNSKWFFLPLPFEWGLPTLSVDTIIYVLPAIVLQSVLSVFLFHGNAEVCGAGRPPRNAVTRGLGVEGLGLAIGSLWGHSATISHSNIGLISFNGIASRRSTELAALMLICLSHFTGVISIIAKIDFRFLFALQFCLNSGLVSVGISILRHSIFSSPRSGFIVGISIFLGFVVPQWILTPGHSPNTGTPGLDNLLTEMLKSSVFVSAITGLFLDLLIPGTTSRDTSSYWRFLAEEDKNIYRLPTWEELLCSFLEKSHLFK